ncbi:MAG: hypothetical protein JKY85_08150, partial [Porticoccus sp.]|nr:hypothetical protein [Porticoccus sp.]
MWTLIQKQQTEITQLKTQLETTEKRVTETEVKTERKFLEKINADCDSPVGAYAKIINNYV